VSLDFETWELIPVRFCRAWRSLNLKVSDYHFEDVVGKCVWEDSYEAADFEQSPLTRYLRALPSGLKELVVIADWCYYTNTATENGTWERNVARFRDFIWPDVSRLTQAPRLVEVAEGREAKSAPLYLGSRVCLDGNVLLPERP